MVMAKWLTAIILITTLAGRALAGAPPHTGGPQCAMPGCCEAAQENDGTEEFIAAQMCCAVNCSLPAETAPNKPTQDTPKTVSAVSPAYLQSLAATSELIWPRGATPTASPTSQPAYIRHLALLI